MEQISERYGAQAVVISIDPRRVWVKDPSETKNRCVKSAKTGPDGETYCWWQCTVKGGREGRDIGAYELAVAMEDLGAGEILLNCIDEDGQGNGFDHELVGLVSDAVSIPVIASSGAGKPSHFTDVFGATNCSAALAAGIFHREEVKVEEVKAHMREGGCRPESGRRVRRARRARRSVLVNARASNLEQRAAVRGRASSTPPAPVLLLSPLGLPRASRSALKKRHHALTMLAFSSSVHASMTFSLSTSGLAPDHSPIFAVAEQEEERHHSHAPLFISALVSASWSPMILTKETSESSSESAAK